MRNNANGNTFTPWPLTDPLHMTNRLLAAAAGSSNFIMRLAGRPVGASVCLALGYVALCSAYFILTGHLVAVTSWSLKQMHQLELVKGLAFVFCSSLLYFGFAFYLLKRIAAQQQHIALLFNGVSDAIFLIEVE